jgi:hypothetical protein
MGGRPWGEKEPYRVLKRTTSAGFCADGVRYLRTVSLQRTDAGLVSGIKWVLQSSLEIPQLVRSFRQSFSGLLVLGIPIHRGRRSAIPYIKRPYPRPHPAPCNSRSSPSGFLDYNERVTSLVLLAAAITITTSFEGGSAGAVQHLSDSHLRVGVRGDKDQNGRNRQATWYYFEVRHAQPGKPLILDMVDLPGEYNFQPNRGAITAATPPSSAMTARTGRTWKLWSTTRTIHTCVSTSRPSHRLPHSAYTAIHRANISVN